MRAPQKAPRSIRLPTEWDDELRAVADKEDESEHALILRFIRTGLDTHHP